MDYYSERNNEQDKKLIPTLDTKLCVSTTLSEVKDKNHNNEIYSAEKSEYRGRSKSGRILTFIFLVSLILNIVGVVVLLLKLCHGKNSDTVDHPDLSKLTGYGPVCFECGSTIFTNLFYNVKYTRAGQKLCCLNNEPGLSDLMKLLIFEEIDRRKQGSNDDLKSLSENTKLPKTKWEIEKVKQQLHWWRNRSDAAHLYLNTTTLSDASLKWNNKETFGSAFISARLRLVGNDSRISVSSSGIYFVYSTLTIDFKNESPIPIVYHSVSRQHPLLPQTGSQMLLMRKYGGSSKGDRWYNSFLCANLKLRRGDELSVYFSDPRLIYESSSASYFGIFKL